VSILSHDLVTSRPLYILKHVCLLLVSTAISLIQNSCHLLFSLQLYTPSETHVICLPIPCSTLILPCTGSSIKFFLFTFCILSSSQNKQTHVFLLPSHPFRCRIYLSVHMTYPLKHISSKLGFWNLNVPRKAGPGSHNNPHRTKRHNVCCLA
jgi:hypothetical protein